MEVDVLAVVEDRGRLTLDGLPFEPGRKVRVHVSGVPDFVPTTPERTPEEWVKAMEDLAAEIHARHPNTPVLTDYEMSRESIYEDERGL